MGICPPKIDKQVHKLKGIFTEMSLIWSIPVLVIDVWFKLLALPHTLAELTKMSRPFFHGLFFCSLRLFWYCVIKPNHQFWYKLMSKVHLSSNHVTSILFQSFYLHIYLSILFYFFHTYSKNIKYFRKILPDMLIPNSLNILCFGDSLTAGFILPEYVDHPYSRSLKSTLEQKLPQINITVNTQGQSGDMVISPPGQFLSRLQKLCRYCWLWSMECR